MENKKIFTYCQVPEDPDGGYAGQGDLKNVPVTREECEKCGEECYRYKMGLDGYYSK